ncbi:MAG: type II toxin-antitoxin system death-on-curing family toxin [Legionella sp.]|uniref:type II toxin-antitoxin system death-on-curing family toxin n=1 Tax=Legionella sp. TaxID=459 RepID=UPI0039E5AD64
MKEPQWILESVVLKIYEQQMKEHGGEYGIRDIGLLQSALNHPKNLWQYQKSDLYGLAAAYAARICANHPFIDGNKRVAFVIMRLFLKLNGKDVHASPQDKINIFMLLANGRILEDELREWIYKNTV